MNRKENARKCRIDIRYTQSEKDIIIKAAKEKDIPLSDYIRSRTLKNERHKVLRKKDRRIMESSVELNKSINELEEYLFNMLPEEMLYQTGIVGELKRLKEGAANLWESCLT